MPIRRFCLLWKDASNGAHCYEISLHGTKQNLTLIEEVFDYFTDLDPCPP